MKNNKRKNIRKAYPVSKGTLDFLLLLKKDYFPRKTML